MASAIAAVKRLVRHGARIRYRLLLVNVIVAVVPIAGLLFADLYEDQLLAGLERDMIHQAQLVRAMIAEDEPRPLANRELALRAAARDTRMRIRLLDGAGALAADSHRGGPPEGPELPVPYLMGGESPAREPSVPEPIAGLAERREIRAALAGRYGSATRLWGTQDRVFLFAALPILRDGRIEGVVYVTRSTSEIKLELYRLRSWLSNLALVALACAALLTLLLATTIARPLGRLTRRAQRIAARQPVEADARFEHRADEIGQLAAAIGAMTDELERRARDARTLAADISHEFKTPLTGIRGAAELLRDGAAEDPEARDRFLAMILDDAARLDRLVTRLLEASALDDDRGVALPIELAELATRCASRPWPVAVEVTGEAIIRGRAGQLTAALDNLVANATQFAEDGPVTIAISRRGELARVAVSNRGPALSPAAQRKVWDRFYSTRAASGGSGLGLAIVRSVALAHGGGVGVECAGGITTFWFEVRG